MLDVHDTTDWPAERFYRYSGKVTQAMKKLEERFPRDIRVDYLASEITGTPDKPPTRRLWIILDDEEFVSFVLTAVEENAATGLKTMVIPSFAGEEGQLTVPLIHKLEAWGAENGCDESMIYGRYGWKRSIAQQGYELDMCVFRKKIGEPK